ncbi:MAG: hypothetical protein LAT80_10095 [Balneolaceae bacterium]|nr:hypothetical protein [Balneolaceae bacterium]
MQKLKIECFQGNRKSEWLQGVDLNILDSLRRSAINYKGWRTSRKIVVIESDDWGAIRMPSKKAYDEALKKGIRVDKSPYCRFDSLASEEDLERLFELLISIKDKNGRSPVITANSIMANPDFDKIRESGFKEYFYKPFYESFSDYSEHRNCLKLWKQGLEEGIFVPQLHGREHVNVELWLELLGKKDKRFIDAFNLGFWGISTDVCCDMNRSIQATFDINGSVGKTYTKDAIQNATEIFKSTFGFAPRSFIAPNFIWGDDIEKQLRESGFTYIQGMKYRKLPKQGSEERKLIRRNIGERDSGFINLVRNCTFEPSLLKKRSKTVEMCLADVKNAFFWKKPAIITTHRINFISFIDKKNATGNIELLSNLLNQITEKWPGVEFMNSVELGKLIEADSA